jgi:hypothetical protein
MEIRLNRPQSLAHQALQPGNSVCIPWGRGVGKTHVIKTAWWTSVAKHEHVVRANALKYLRGVRIVHLMPTFKQCKDIYKNDTLEALHGEWAFLRPKIDQTIWKITFPGGSWIQWFGAREANSARGVRADIVTVDEADDIDPAVLDSVVKPWFTEPWSMRMVLLGGTPRRGRYGLLYREYDSGLRGEDVRAGSLQPKAKLAEFLRRKYTFHATYRDAPENVDRAYIEEQRADHEDKGKLDVFEREYECNFDSAEGLVYAMFDREFHVREAPPQNQWDEVLVGCDFGYEDPGVILVAAVVGHGKDAMLYVTEEIYQTKQTPTWWREKARGVVEKYPSAKWYLDTASPAMADEYRSVGARVQHFNKGQIEDGVRAVADRFSIRKIDDSAEEFARLYVAPQCRNMIAELGKYRRRRDPKNVDRFLDDIEDANNHANDACRYMIVGRFGGPERRRYEDGAGW